MNNPLQNINTLKNKKNDLFYSIEKIKSKRETEIEKETEIVLQILSAKKRLEIKDEVKEHLNNLQNISQKKSIGLFTDLLTAMVHDVLPKNKEQSVHFELSTKRNTPNLDIMMKIDNEHYEDIMSGRGGSLTNVVSTGLRYVTLSRTRNRRFMILDEPDNWVNTEAVPRFAKVISDISKKVGVQTITITHKNPDLYNARVIELYRDSKGNVNSRVLQEDKDEGYIDSDEYSDINKTKLLDNVGIKKVKFKNFMSLKNVELSLSPTMNVIVGEGDIGKSAVFAGIDAFVNNNCHPRMINHDSDSFIIEIEVESGIILQLEHKRKGTKKTTYKMEIPSEDGNNEVIIEENGNNVPDFISEALSMEPVDGVNIQLGHQKSSPFMLGPDTTSSKRANLLSLGRESDYIQKMINTYSKELKEDSLLIKEKEKELISTREKITLLETIKDIENEYHLVAPIIEEYDENSNIIKEIQIILNDIESHQKSIHELSDLDNISYLKEEPTLNNQNEINNITSLGKELAGIQKALSALNDIDKIEVPEYIKIKEKDQELLNQLEIFNKNINENSKNIKEIEGQIKRYSEEMNIIIEETGGLCPLCHQNMKHSHQKTGE